MLAVGIIGVITVAISAIIGIASSAYVQANSARAQVSELKALNEQMSQRMATMQVTESNLKRLIELLQEESGVLAEQIVQAKTIINDLVDTLPRTVSVISNIVSRLVSFKEKLKVVSRAWKEGQLEPTLMDIFNVSLPCGKACPLSSATPIECLMDTERSVITLTFDVKILRANTVVIEADPFTLYRKPKPDTICEIIYAGPNKLIFDTKRQCVVTHPSRTLTDTNIVLVPEEGGCLESASVNKTSRYWEAGDCMPLSELRRTDLVQVKSTGPENIVYCEGLMILVYNQSIKCPTKPFAIPSSVEFTVGELHYRSQIIGQQVTMTIESMLTQRVNAHLMPELHSFEFEALVRDFNETMKEVNNDIPTQPVFIFAHKWEYVAAVAIVTLPFIACCYVLNFSPCRRKVNLEEPLEVVGNQDTEPTPQAYFHRSTTVASLGPRRNDAEEFCDIPLTPRGRSASAPLSSHGLMIVGILGIASSLRPAEAQHFTIQLNYKNPCQILGNINSSLLERDWCEKRFEEVFLAPIDALCMPENKSSFASATIFEDNTREKRVVSLSSVSDVDENFTFPVTRQSIDPRNVRINIILTTLGIELENVRRAVRSVITSWDKGKIDPLFTDSFFLGLNITGSKFQQFEPNNCYHDRSCRSIRIQLGSKSSYLNDHLKLGIAFTTPFILIGILKIRKRKEKPVDRRVRFALNKTQIIPLINDEYERPLLPPPPLPQ